MPSPTLFDAHEVQLVPVPTGLSLAGLESWLAELTSHVSGQLVRAKGVVATAEGRLVRVHIVGSRTEITELPQPTNR